MIIAYDVQVMQELIRASQAANDELQKAQSLIQEIHSHSDWTCKEKSVIDDLMRECKNMVKKLCEEQFSFFEAVKIVGEELGEAENSVSNLFQSVESILSKILAIPVLENVVNGGGLIGAVDVSQQIINAGNSAISRGLPDWIYNEIDISKDWGDAVVSPRLDLFDWGEVWPINAPIDVVEPIGKVWEGIAPDIVVISPPAIMPNNFGEAISMVDFDNLITNIK